MGRPFKSVSAAAHLRHVTELMHCTYTEWYPDVLAVMDSRQLAELLRPQRRVRPGS